MNVRGHAYMNVKISDFCRTIIANFCVAILLVLFAGGMKEVLRAFECLTVSVVCFDNCLEE